MGHTEADPETVRAARFTGLERKKTGRLKKKTTAACFFLLRHAHREHIDERKGFGLNTFTNAKVKYLASMATRRVFRVFALLCALFLLYVSFPQVSQFGGYIRQTNPFSGQKDIEQSFVPTEVELACLNGRLLSADSSSSTPSSDFHDAIPNIAHFIFGLKNPLYHSGAGHFDFLNYLAVRSAIVSLRPDAVYLHYTYLSEPPSPDANADPLSNPWVRRLSKDITLVHHPPDSSNNHFAHMSDTLRLQILQEQGGIYLDMDSYALRSFEPLLRSPRPRDVVLGAEGGNRWGLCNAVLAARPNSSFVARWLNSYRDGGDSEGAPVDLRREWNYHSVLLPRVMAQGHPDEVCTLPPDAFFWPTWTWRHVEWMHAPLSPTEARACAADIDRHGGSLFENQVAYHAWNQMAWDRYLKRLTPKIVRSEDTRFNILMRRFMESDL